MVRESQIWILNTVKTVVAYRASLEYLGAIVDVLCGPFLFFLRWIIANFKSVPV